METSYLIPQQLGQLTKVSKPDEIAKICELINPNNRKG